MNYKGKLLIAKPILNDSFFSKTVIYITDYEEKRGAVGFVLNKTYEKKLSDLIPDVETDMTVYVGGPVNQDHLFVIHSRPDVIQGGVSINEDFFWSGDYEQIKNAVNDKLIKEEEIRFFLGYSGWGKRQLEGELNREDWLVTDSEKVNILKWDENIWKNQLIKIDKTNIIWVNSPANPELN
ncbi:YqgE/AlgH family protein [Apibacter raozihei]|uniref:YqgE/AlgH family protein n=1 Tax=Apibacter TaxID=1778601 RepID=UPI000FE36DEE|nr:MULTISPECIES: YqgE/AlgH family protein [Apibacter]